MVIERSRTRKLLYPEKNVLNTLFSSFLSQGRMPMFTKVQGLQIYDGQFNNAGRDVNNYYNSADPLQALWLAVKDVGAGHNSEARYPPPKCHPGTRRGVLNVLNQWIHSPSLEDRVFWLYGPAGAGKSALAQTIAETGQQASYLVSSFFFSRSDTRRNTAQSLFLTIAYELTFTIPELREPIGRVIRDNPALLQASYEEQFRKLIFEPCWFLMQQYDHPWLIIIDGLDECDGSQEQQRILFILATVLSESIRLRFLICSRPEPAIQEAFNADPFRPYLRRVVLDEKFRPNRDIKMFLDNEFERIRGSPRNRHIQFPVPWPARGIVYELVQKASGQFIYATTVIKFVDDEYTNPCTQLELVLHPDPHPELRSPFHDLDVLYHQILSSNPQQSRVREVLRALLLFPRLQRYPPLPLTPRIIETLLILREGEVISTLRGMHSILEIGGLDDEIHFFHASFGDFCRDETRSGYFFIGDKPNQHRIIACQFLRAFNHYFHIHDGYEGALPPAQRSVFCAVWNDWGYHCSNSVLDVEVLDALRSVDFTASLGSYIKICQYDRIRTFFLQTEYLLQRLSVRIVDADVYADVIQRFSDYRTGFSVKISLPQVQPQALEAAATALAYSLIGVANPPRPGAGRRNKGFLDFFRREDFDVTAFGNDCRCTRLDKASSLLSWPCSESPSGEVYHVQTSVAFREPTRIALHDVKRWYSDNRTQCLAHRSHRGDEPWQPCHTLLSICGPCPEFLKLLPPLLSKVVSEADRDGIIKWLKSFPSEYKSQTSPLEERLQQVHCFDDNNASSEDSEANMGSKEETESEDTESEEDTGSEEDTESDDTESGEDTGSEEDTESEECGCSSTESEEGWSD
ncbi:nwd2 [Moniliophthora roreri MCA 2997]|uniref:Nwd2 n=1 Tax=Moniliophthora roreri (strain MCA 2997) TaxID=1381753 RepID=V2WR98_MONRO|nr:nwd2 [Moniliophthora roreri MCA 2997]